MFGWFRSKASCPVEPQDREWIEWRMAWLADTFGWDRMRSVRVILPTPEFFPDAYFGTEVDARVMLSRVCDYMGLPLESVKLSFYKDRNPDYEGQWQQGTSGLYHEEQGKFWISVEVSNLDDPLGLVGTLAHELAHVHLLGHKRISADVEDHEPLTDLLTVFLGLGVFTANSVIHEDYWNQGHASGWSVGRRGYLSMPMYGYALALFAQARGEVDPVWAKDLRLDVGAAFKQGARFLAETGDSLFRAQASQPPQQLQQSGLP
jgi:hypothetical protein